MRNIGRMEWLAFELVIEARCVLLERQRNADDTLWKSIEQKLGIGRAESCVGIATAPHTMRLKRRNGLHETFTFLVGCIDKLSRSQRDGKGTRICQEVHARIDM